LTISYSDYVHAGTSLRDMRCRIVTLRTKVADLKLDGHASDKLIRLAGDRYDETTDTLTIVTDR
jgi:small subunit ribosomal protein S35